MRRLPVLVLAMFAFQLAAPQATFAIKGSDLDINGYVGFEAGQMVRSHYQGLPFAHLWLGSSVANVNFKAAPADYISVLIGMEARMWFNTFPPENLRNQNFMYEPSYSAYLHQAQGTMSLMKTDGMAIEAAVGIMPYKYNPAATNLGEYLFRSGTYPAYIVTNFDFPLARLSGGRLSFDLTTDAVTSGLDLLVLTEREMRPFHDLSLAAIANVNVLKLLDIGGGIELAHLWAVQDTMTSSGKDDNTYINGADTGKYTFTGTKVMARGTVDPLFTMRESMAEVLGGGGKIYGELAILGLKSYPASGNSNNPWGYTSLAAKMPMMFGLTLPAWKIFDVCALEFEYFNCPYPDSYDRVIRKGFPQPTPTLMWTGDSTVYQHDNWKWNIYLKKNIGQNIGLVMQLGRDHTRYEFQGVFAENANEFEAAMIKPNEWAWRTKMEFRF